MRPWLARRRGALAASVAVTLMCLLQDPGRVTPDTKLDLAVDPVGFMSRALHMWEPRSNFGHVQNQAVGYLFPMGPFFALGKTIGVPMWVVQRLWMALLLTVALWGALRVAEALRIGTPTTRLLGAAVYALSPPMTSFVTSASGGQIPMALLPWILLPLITGANGGSTRRAAARSGIAVFAMGAVNATSTIAVLPLPALWLITRRRGARRASLIRWWLLCTLLACVWWAIPLLLQGRFGFDFAPYTERTGVTTATTSAFEVLRGTGHWLEYLFVNGPWLRGAWMLATNALAIAATGALAAGGVYGLARRDMPERTFLVLGMAVGVVAICAAYGGPFGGALSAPMRTLLDGGLTAFRNLTKLEPVLRLPLALGLVHAAAQIELRPVERTVGVAFLTVVVAVAALPFLRGDAVPDGAFRRVPGYWADVARWLGAHGRDEQTLVVPAAAFGEYMWGRPLDEPMEPLARTPWAVRSLVPLGSAGLTRLLSGVDQEVTRASSSALAGELGRIGVRYLLVRNDLDPRRTSAPPPAQVRRALMASDGISAVASFGPATPGGLTPDRLAPDLGEATRPVHSVDLYEVRRPTTRAVAYPSANAVTLSGGPEALLQLATRSDLTGRAVSLTGDARAPSIAANDPVSADVTRRRDTNFGRVRDNESYALTATEPAPGSNRPPQDFAVPTAARSLMRMTGATEVTASSYESPVALHPERQPWAALDGDPATAWVAGSPFSSVGEWLEVRFTRPIDARSITVRLLRDSTARPYASALTLSTGAGSVTRRLRDAETPQRLELPSGSSAWLRISIAAVSGGFGQVGVGLREVELPGVRIERTAVLPGVTPSAAPPTFLLDRLRSDPYDATRDDEEARLDRVVELAGPQSVSFSGLATPRPGQALDALLSPYHHSRVGVVASSTWRDLPAFTYRNLVDGEPGTAWVAQPADQHPSVELSWVGDRTIDSLVLSRAPGPTLVPTKVQLLAPSGTRDIDIPPSGEIAFPPLVTDRVTVRVVEAAGTDDLRHAQGFVTPPAVGLGALRFPALDDLRTPPLDPATAVDIPCGEGPPVMVDGRPLQTALTGRVGDLMTLGSLALRICDPPAALGKGEHRIQTLDTGAFSVDSLTLGQPASSGNTDPGRRVRVQRWGAAARSLDVDPGPQALLGTNENFNAGWEAHLGSRRLAPTQLDGWRQGWVVPAGPGGHVVLTFRPDRLYRGGLLAGAVAVLLVVVLAFSRPRRPKALNACEPGTIPARAAVVAAAATAFLCGGWAVLIVLPLLVLLRSRVAVLAGASAVLATGIAAGQHAYGPASGVGAFGGPAQLLTIVAVAGTVMALSSRGTPDAGA